MVGVMRWLAVSLVLAVWPCSAAADVPKVKRAQQSYRPANPRQMPMAPFARVVRLTGREPVTPGIPTLADLRGGHAADPDTSTIYTGTRLDRFGRAHEHGHLAEKFLSEGDRRFFSRVLGMPNTPWEAEYGRHGKGAVSEVFADYYASAALGIDPGGKPDRDGAVRGTHDAGYAQIDARRLKKYARAMDRLRRRQGLPAYK